MYNLQWAWCHVELVEDRGSGASPVTTFEMLMGMFMEK